MRRMGSSGQERPTPFPGGVVGRTSAGQRTWRCCICGAVGLWAPGWMWYGSMRDWDEGTVRLVACPKDEARLRELVGEPPA